MTGGFFRRLSLGLCLTSALAAVPVSAEGSRAPDPQWMRAEAVARIVAGDVELARYRAERLALLKGLEQESGIHISAGMSQVSGRLAGHHLIARSGGYVREWKVEEVSRHDGEVQVEVRMKVGTEPNLISLEHVAAGRLMVLVGCGPEPATALTLRRLMEPSLQWPGLIVHRTALPAVGARGLPAPAEARRLGERYNAELVLCVSSRSHAMGLDIGYPVAEQALRPVVSASGRASLYSGHSGELVGSWEISDIRGSDAADPQRAAENAMHRLAELLGPRIVRGVSETLRAQGWILRLTVSGSGLDPSRVRQRLEQSAWIERLEIETATPEESTFLAWCKDDPVLAVEEIRAAGAFSVRSYRRSPAELRLVAPGG